MACCSRHMARDCTQELLCTRTRASHRAQPAFQQAALTGLRGTHTLTHACTHSHTQRRGHKHEAVHREVEGAYNHSMHEITKELKVFLKMKTCVCGVWIHFSSNTVCVCLLENTATREGRVMGSLSQVVTATFSGSKEALKSPVGGSQAKFSLVRMGQPGRALPQGVSCLPRPLLLHFLGKKKVRVPELIWLQEQKHLSTKPQS